jgi:hypothetical protein
MVDRHHIFCTLDVAMPAIDPLQASPQGLIQGQIALTTRIQGSGSTFLKAEISRQNKVENHGVFFSSKI